MVQVYKCYKMVTMVYGVPCEITYSLQSNNTMALIFRIFTCFSDLSFNIFPVDLIHLSNIKWVFF